MLGPMENLQLRVQQIRKIFPTRKDMRICMPAILRGSIIGTIIGALPGAGATIASIISYNVTAGIDKNPERFGTGVIEGIAAPESANNASVGGAMIPLLTLGIPGSTITAILIGAFMVHDIYPGPLLFKDHLDLVYVIFIGLIIASFGFALFGYLSAYYAPLVLKAPPAIVTPLIAVFCLVGAYASNGSPWDIGLAIFFGVFAYIIGEFGIPDRPDHPGLCPRAPRGDQFPFEPPALGGQSDDLPDAADLPGDPGPHGRDPAVPGLEGAAAQRDPFRSGLAREAVGTFRFRSGPGRAMNSIHMRKGRERPGL